MEKQESIDALVVLHEELKRNLKLELEHEVYKLRNFINNYYVLNDPDYIEYIRDNICKRKRIIASNNYNSIADVVQGVAIALGIVGLFSNPTFLIFAASAYLYSGYLRRKPIGMRHINKSIQKLKDTPIDKWENILNMYKKKYMEIIK